MITPVDLRYVIYNSGIEHLPLAPMRWFRRLVALYLPACALLAGATRQFTFGSSHADSDRYWVMGDTSAVWYYRQPVQRKDGRVVPGDKQVARAPVPWSPITPGHARELSPPDPQIACARRRYTAREPHYPLE